MASGQSGWKITTPSRKTHHSRLLMRRETNNHRPIRRIQARGIRNPPQMTGKTPMEKLGATIQQIHLGRRNSLRRRNRLLNPEMKLEKPERTLQNRKSPLKIGIQIPGDENSLTL